MRIEQKGLALALATIAGVLYGSGVAGDEPQVRPEVREQTTQAPPAKNPPSAPAPATSFTPTEKIKADSSVSFPVDI
jgi:hypothetical protein